MDQETLNKLKPFLQHEENCSVAGFGSIDHQNDCPYEETDENDNSYLGVLEPCPCGIPVCNCGLWDTVGVKPRDWSFELDTAAIERFLESRRMDENTSGGDGTFYGCDTFTSEEKENMCGKPPTLVFADHRYGDLDLRCTEHEDLHGERYVLARIDSEGKLGPP